MKKKTVKRMSRPEQDVMIHLEVTPDSVSFDIMFPGGFQKTVVVDRYEIAAARCSIRDYAQNIVTDYFELNQLPVDNLKFIFY